MEHSGLIHPKSVPRLSSFSAIIEVLPSEFLQKVSFLVVTDVLTYDKLTLNKDQ